MTAPDRTAEPLVVSSREQMRDLLYELSANRDENGLVSFEALQRLAYADFSALSPSHGAAAGPSGLAEEVERIANEFKWHVWRLPHAADSGDNVSTARAATLRLAAAALRAPAEGRGEEMPDWARIETGTTQTHPLPDGRCVVWLMCGSNRDAIEVALREFDDAAASPSRDRGELREPTDADVENVELALGYSHGAWDMVDPKQIIAAAWAELQVVELEPGQEEVALHVSFVLPAPLAGAPLLDAAQ